jgi:hypothetical protein
METIQVFSHLNSETVGGENMAGEKENEASSL